MKRLLSVLAVCGLGGVALALAAVPNSPDGAGLAAGQPRTSESAEGKLVVHEWGTFTGFAGSDGVHLRFGTDVGNDLPPFVINRQTQATRNGVELSIGFMLRKGGGVYALQRMETPVIYFYTDRPRDVSVAVDFPQGLLTEFYPPVRAMTPAFGDGPGEFGAVGGEGGADADPPIAFEKWKATMTGGSLDWGKVHINPQTPGGPSVSLPEVPATAPDAQHYQYARETDAATVHYADRTGEQHAERFLFYRGLGDFTLPVTLTAALGDRFELNNAGEQPIGSALLVRVADGRAQFATYRDVRGAQAMSLPAEAVALTDVGDAIARALVAEGLYEKEARAMVKTWSSSWLGEPGTRVLYTVPRAVTDDLLPLRVDPAPAETVRVLVGRIDVMTPEQEARIQSLLAGAGDAESLAADDAAFLHAFGRFYEPAVERAAKLRSDRDAKRDVSKLRTLYYNTPRAVEAIFQDAVTPR